MLRVPGASIPCSMRQHVEHLASGGSLTTYLVRDSAEKIPTAQSAQTSLARGPNSVSWKTTPLRVIRSPTLIRTSNVAFTLVVAASVWYR